MIEALGRAQHADAVRVLCQAFRRYPVMSFVLGRECTDAEDPGLRALVGFYVARRLLRRWPVFSLSSEGERVATALVSPPDRSPDPPSVVAALARLRGEIGEEAFGRMQRFEAASDANEPAGDHWFVGMLGVRPDHQGTGLGSTLLAHVHERARDAGASGVCLSTEERVNVGFYESLGYVVVAEADVDEALHTWCLYRTLAE